MRLSVLSRLIVLLSAAALAAACTSPGIHQHPDPSSAPSRPGTTRPNEADRLAAAALGAWADGQDAALALALVRRADQIDAGRADLVWLQLRLCMLVRGCEPEHDEARLRKLDPSNGVAWLGVLARAQAQRDIQAQRSILEAMSRAERFDLYWTTLVWRLTQAHYVASAASRDDPQAQRKRNPDTQPVVAALTAAMNDVTGWLSRIDTSALQSVTSSCRPQPAVESAVLASCKRIAAAMQHSDTTLVEGLGLGIARRLTTPQSADAAELDERIATLSYRSETASVIMQGQLERERFTAQVLQLMKTLPREQDVSRAILRWAGRPLSPAG